VVWFQVEVQGLPVHVREMGTGANAIDAAYRIIGELRKLEADWNAKKSGRAHFEDEEHPINLNIGKIEGGDWASSVPAWCRIDCRISIYPGWNAKSASHEIRDRIAKFALSDDFLSNIPPVVTFNGFQAEGYVLEPGSDAERVLKDPHLSSTGKPLQSFMTAGYLDTRVYALYDKIPALCYGPYSENIHGFDERVSLASLKRVTTTMALFIAEWCGLEAIAK
jgi:acetylornithine deacetylase